MADLKTELTDKSVARLPYAAVGQHRVRDTDLKGFFVQVGKHTKSYMVQGEHWCRGTRTFTSRVKLGEYGDISTRDARAKAKDVLGMIARGERPGAPEIFRAAPSGFSSVKAAEMVASPSICLGDAWERYRVSHLERKNRSHGTIANYRDHVERLMADWLNTPLADLADDADRVARKHDKITTDHGPYIANGCMRSLRAIYNHAWLKNKRLLPPDNPVEAVDWNPEARRNTGMGLGDLLGWFAQLAALENPIRREYHLFTLLSGCRPTALKNARFEHLDLRRRILHIANPKGGPKRAFDIPLSRQMICCLVRAIRYGRLLHPDRAKVWLFPAESESGHLEEHKEDRADLSKWGNDLRQSFRTLAAVAKVSAVDAKLLMNHALPGVNEGYITRDKLLEDHLRSQQQAISTAITKPVHREIDRPGLLRAWLGPRGFGATVEAGTSSGTNESRQLDGSAYQQAI